MLAIEIANLVALKRSPEVPSRIKSLLDLLETQPADFKLQWSFAGTKHFISQNQQLTADKNWLLRLFEAWQARIAMQSSKK